MATRAQKRTKNPERPTANKATKNWRSRYDMAEYPPMHKNPTGRKGKVVGV